MNDPIRGDSFPWEGKAVSLVVAPLLTTVPISHHTDWNYDRKSIFPEAKMAHKLKVMYARKWRPCLSNREGTN